MNPGIVLAMLIVLTAAVVVAVGAAAFVAFRRPWRLACPRDGREAQVQVDALRGARAEVFGLEPSVARCSLWPVTACGEQCLDTSPDRRRSVARGEPRPQGAGRPTILVPLDGTDESEAVLPTARALARARDARVRLLRVVPPVEAVRDEDERVIAWLDQEAASAEAAARDYLRRVEAGLDGFDVETVVRFGNPADEILHESDARDVVLIAMATRPRRWFRRSVTARVAGGAWVPIVRTPYRVAA
jgi:nucleotide-binding universal stress UspA family protein